MGISRFFEEIENFFYIDKRSLLLFRVSLGLLLFYDLIMRLSDYQAHYSINGVFLLEDLFHYEWNSLLWFKPIISGFAEHFYLIFIISIISVLFLILGVYPNLFLVIIFFSLSLIQSRNPIVFQGGDDLLRLLVFWSIFLPLNGIATDKSSFKVSNIASMAILIQVLFPYFFSGLFKGRTEWWFQGSALYYAWNLDQITRPLGLFLKEFNWLSKFLTRTVYLYELLILPIFLFPIEREKVRVFVGLSLILFNIGIISTMMIGIFPLCFITASVLFIPSSFWNWFNSNKLNPFQHLKSLGKYQRDFRFMNSFQYSWWTQSALGFILILVILWNVSTIPRLSMSFPSILKPLMVASRIEQSWGMFAPTVFKEDGWLILKAKTKNGKILDLLSIDFEYSEEKPEYVLDKYKNDRNRKFTEQMLVPSRSYLHEPFINYHLQKVRKSLTEEEIDEIELIYMKEFTPVMGEKPNLEKVTLKKP